MRAPYSEPLGEAKEREVLAGAWIEVRDVDERRLWWRILHDPFHTRIEGRGGTGGFTNGYRNHPHGVFVVVVPDFSEAHTVALFSSPLERERRNEAAHEVAAFQLPDRR
jgi:hypothetical protein